ncbi:hypothetical protein [Corynebacterium sp.]|nr:hypothetical protein [Corynebacterium sp.]MDO5512602.1 hypothetical protein [Corynebacterium sp.]
MPERHTPLKIRTTAMDLLSFLKSLLGFGFLSSFDDWDDIFDD